MAWRNREVRVARAFRSRLAFATGLPDCGGTEGGRPVEYTLRLTLGLTRTPDGWRIVQEHSSEPMPFDEKVEG
ncbi:nuclear transport factor 2 family protein [Sinorhizobium meliloti]|uniref:nuclear transport factor 2 family protein n=1 Tax=Rhizobium meliloti TaxID=382 RepID=UPI000404FF53|nr:nuclear transport factor 2 family protein [Sinorhizobium meliloti]RVM03541.1 hypothetical protein CN125_30190 [Sinorhizobium meliloti]RVM43018.1 hypothetical protein CN121_25170 [Sinorhizobium meliloti]RVM60099.1 hypothetical protein CN124_26725 [Sinorhizobium meliloti]RVM62412.1 hypothetical protein CN123_27480 [Sinorhizobium meliloti]RVM80630.1 hypothetical protein CN117_23985 [Sinorhizobium meliloti]